MEYNCVHSALRPVTNRPVVPAPDDYDGGEIDGMIGKGT
jgi:hypothetical protein